MDSPRVEHRTGASAAAALRPRPAARRAPWLAAAVLLFLVTAAWSVAIPLMGSPDEPSHVIKAAAVARGQWSGEVGGLPTDTTRPGAGTTVLLPADYRAAALLPNCFAFQPDEAADCQQDVPPSGGELVPVETFAGQYPPLYYAMVGWPSLVLGAEASTYAMRLVSAALTAGLVTWGAYRLARVPGHRLALWGVAAAVSPMTLFLGGTVNPQGLEIALAFAFWCTCLALVSPGARVTTAGIVQAAVAGALLVNVRTSSPFWALVVVVVALVVAAPGRWGEIVRHPATRWAAVGAAVASAAAVAWVLVHGNVVTGGGLYPQYGDVQYAALRIAGRGEQYLANMVGDFGWLDAPAPPLTTIAWYVAVGALVLVGLSLTGGPRQKAGLLLLLAVVAGAPFALQVPTAADAGLIWQGRYALPIAVGVPLLAALLLVREQPQVRAALHRTARGSLLVILVAHVAAFYWASRRYAEGLVTGEVVTATPQWSSPIGYLTGAAAYAVVLGALTLLLWRALGPAAEPTAAPGGAGSPVPAAPEPRA